MDGRDVFGDAEIISTYTADQAIEDGTLVEASPQIAQDAGFVWPVRVTPKVLDLATPRSKHSGQSIEGRLSDILWVLRIEIRKAGEDRMIVFRVKLGRAYQTLWAAIDTTSGAPAIHIMTPEEY